MCYLLPRVLHGERAVLWDGWMQAPGCLSALPSPCDVCVLPSTWQGLLLSFQNRHLVLRKTEAKRQKLGASPDVLQPQAEDVASAFSWVGNH